MCFIRRGVILLCVSIFCMADIGYSAFERQRIQALPWNTNDLSLVSALANNPGRLQNMDRAVVASGYTRIFNQKALQSGYLYSALPLSFGTVGLGVDFFGNQEYAESQYMAGIARQWNENGAFGLLIRAFSLDISNYGNANSLAIDAGTSWRITESLQWELGYGNLTQSTIGRSKEPLPQQIFSAVEYSPKDYLSTRLSVVHDLRYPVRYRAGVGYAPFTWIEFAALLSTEPVRAQIGTTITWKMIHVQYTATIHSVLPVTHRFGLLFGF
ncbi:MAG: hypothetical protein MAGBODY4_00784 [Candidatus Marinimicrobia bacterium]|nr:hypothetical protein [Candidatus Neomarinimicrobiota bacterium]